MREAYNIAASRQLAIPDVQNPALLITIHKLPASRGTHITALNFGPTSICETIHVPGVAPGPVVDMINETVEGDLGTLGDLVINLDGYEGLSLRVVSALPTIGEGTQSAGVDPTV